MKLNTIICAAAVCGCVSFATAAEEVAETAETEKTPVVSAEFGLQFDSKYMTYGVVDGKDPILTPSATVKFFDWVYFGVSSIYDLTKGNGKRGFYGNRAGEYTTIDATVGIAHDFDLGETLGTLSVDVNYIYEYLRRDGNWELHDGDKMGDTQYLNLEFSLEDLLLEPTLWIERDLMADEGTYVNFNIGHTFALVGEGDDVELVFRPSVGQGWGNTLRTHGYFNDYVDDGFSHGGLMDTTLKGELTWQLCEHVALSGYVAYSDYLFDANMRDAARAYNAAWGHSGNHSWNFYGGVGLTVSF